MEEAADAVWCRDPIKLHQSPMMQAYFWGWAKAGDPKLVSLTCKEVK